MSAVREVVIGEAPSASMRVHYLQGCKIEFNGEAPVSEYFKPTVTGTQPDGTTVLEASFRGRRMKGSEVSLPDGFSGAVLEKKEGSNGTEATTSYTATGTFPTFTYWNHDTAPVATDGVRRAMEWAALASHIHKPVDPKDVEAAVAAKKEVDEKKKPGVSSLRRCLNS